MRRSGLGVYRPLLLLLLLLLLSAATSTSGPSPSPTPSSSQAVEDTVVPGHQAGSVPQTRTLYRLNHPQKPPSCCVAFSPDAPPPS
ncbi:hypothetical protein STEG23_012839 [Scotinomys teguina]